jgi:hypothetical protein
MTLAQAQDKIPTILRTIYHALNAGNPLEASHYFSSDIANDNRQIDSICQPFTYKAHYIEAIIERPDQTFEVRVHALFAPFREKVQVLIFRSEGSSLVLSNVIDIAPIPWTWSNAVGQWYEPYAETAIQMARDFIYAAKAQRSDVLAGMAATGIDVSQYTTEPCWKDLFGEVTEVSNTNASFDNYHGLTIKVDAVMRTSRGSYTGPALLSARFWFDMILGHEKLVAAEPFYDAYGNMFFQKPASCSNVGKSFFATVEAPNLEADTLKRFGLQSTSSSVAGTGTGAGNATPGVSQASTSEPSSPATQQKIVAANGNLRISVSECHVQEGKVFCRGELTYSGQGTKGFQMGGGASMIDDHGGEFQRSDAWFGELNGPHQPTAQLPSGIPVACVWVYDGYTPGSKSINLVFPNEIVLRNVPLKTDGSAGNPTVNASSTSTATVLSQPDNFGGSCETRQDYVSSMVKGNTALTRSSWDEAIADYLAASQICPRVGQPYLEIGYVDLTQGRFDDAKQNFSKSTDLGFPVVLPSVEHKAFFNTSGMLSIGREEVKFMSRGKEIFRAPVSQVTVKGIGAAAIAGPNSFYVDLSVGGKKHRLEYQAGGVVCSFDNGDNLVCDGNGFDQQRAVAEWVSDAVARYSAGAPSAP